MFYLVQNLKLQVVNFRQLQSKLYFKYNEKCELA